MDPFALPPKEKLAEIAARQDEKEQEIQAARQQQSPNEQAGAAKLIQRNYRGYRERRELEGHGISPSTRWLEAVKEAEYLNSTRPISRTERSSSQQALRKGSSNEARTNWRRAGMVARRAGSDDTSETDGEDGMTEEQREKYRQRKQEAKAEREKMAKTMGLQYFLEMVDQKHRYGSNLRAYHAVWKQSDSKENFFYWLDYGEGKDVDLEDRPRKRLDEERVRYLSREERQRYLVNINKDGLLCWAKDGTLITTSPDFKDSIDGIVPIDDKRLTWREATQGIPESDSDEEPDSASDISTGSQEDATRYVNQDLHNAHGIKKVKYVSAGALMNRLLRKTTKKNTWIFVADTSFRLYLGIKQSGAFQHSSFLHGARVSAAGLIKIKHGQLRRLSPLSGHYAPPARNFKAFVRSLKEAGADLSRVNISRSYAVLVGLEGYLGAKRTVKKGEQRLKDVMKPEEARMREEQERDKSQSAAREREILEAQARELEERKRQQPLPTRLKQKIGRENSNRSLSDAQAGAH